MNEAETGGMGRISGNWINNDVQYAIEWPEFERNLERARLLRAAVKQHAANMNVFAAASKVVFRDDDLGRTPPAQWSPYTYLPHLTAALQTWVGWMDAGTVDGALARYAGGTGPQTVVIGPWSHGAASDGHQADPFDPPNAPLRHSQMKPSSGT